MQRTAAKSGNVQDPPQASPVARDPTLPAQAATVLVKGRHARQRRNFAPIEPPHCGQVRQQPYPELSQQAKGTLLRFLAFAAMENAVSFQRHNLLRRIAEIVAQDLSIMLS